MVVVNRVVLFLAFFSILFIGCRKPINTNWDVDVVLPIVKSELNIKNFAGDSIFLADNTGLLHFKVTREITSLKIDSLLKLPDTTIIKTFTIPTIAKLPPGYALTFFPPTELEFDISNGVALKRVDIRSGQIIIKFMNDLLQPLDLLYVIPSAVKGGQPLKIFETIPPLPSVLTKTYDVSGYSFNMRGISGNVFNTIVQTNTVYVNPDADSVFVNYGQGPKIELSYKDIVPEYVEGYFGQQTIDIPLDTAKLDLVENFHAANFMLNDASLTFNILNGFAAEFSANLSNITSINSGAGNVVPLTNNQLSNININRATRAGTTVFPTVKALSFLSSNSNIVPFLSNLPDRLTYKGNISVNPLSPSNISGYNDFAFHDHGIRVMADIDIPMRFNADYFKLKSNTAVDFSNIEQLENVKSGNFVILATSSYPFKARLQAYMLDEQGLVIDSLFVPEKNSIEAGQLNSQNVVVAPVDSKVLIPIAPEKITKLRKTKSIEIVTYFLMPPNPPDIKIYENYTIKVNIVAELNYNVTNK